MKTVLITGCSSGYGLETARHFHAQGIFASFGQPAAATTESDVAEVAWRGASDATGQLRFPAGADAVALARKSHGR